ncbi:MAG: hypothetical protein EI684_02790 [Candidatus Viridilinea halotolerans]|uniref:Uncharacterized protein n=1 Tax=Candidatus Viridilinea halotolerans TaxID=2491704 RepID=A0A426U8J2_9CHLR|nr:MAG: hypothetical protein EI684_02790 [Candidatus Viridilinea halotolerans]
MNSARNRRGFNPFHTGGRLTKSRHADEAAEVAGHDQPKPAPALTGTARLNASIRKAAGRVAVPLSPVSGDAEAAPRHPPSG